MKALLIILGLITSINTYANLGHRAGSSFYTQMPENSLIVLRESITGAETGYAVQHDENFVYLEFDVYETKDNIPVVTHDKKLKKRVSYNEYNKAAYLAIKSYRKIKKFKKLKIRDLTLAELKTFRVKGNYEQQFATVQEFLDLSRELGLIKPMLVEVKSLHSDIAREAIIRMVEEYKNEYTDQADIIFEERFDFGGEIAVSFLGFKKKFRKSFGKRAGGNWCKKILDAGLYGVFRARKHSVNFCK